MKSHSERKVGEEKAPTMCLALYEAPRVSILELWKALSVRIGHACFLLKISEKPSDTGWRSGEGCFYSCEKDGWRGPYLEARRLPVSRLLQ